MTDPIIFCLYLLSGACLYAGSIHLYAGLRHPRDTSQFQLAGLATLAFLFAISHGASLRARDIAEFVFALKWSLAVSSLFCLLLFWFICQYTHKRPTILLAILSAMYVLMSILNFTEPYSLQYTYISGLRPMTLPWGETITLADGVNSYGFYLGLTATLIGFIYMFYALAGHYRRHPSGTHLGMLLAVGFLFIFLLQGVLVRLSIIHFAHLGWLGFLGMMLALSAILNDENNHRLREKEAKLRGLYEMSPLGIALNDMQGRFVSFNEAFRRISGYEANELGNLDYWTLTPNRYLTQEAVQLKLLAETGYYGPYEKEYRRKDGQMVAVRLNGMLITGAKGEEYIWSIVEDISEWKRVHDQLAESEERYRRIVETSSEGIWAVDTGFRTTFVNAALCQMLGCGADEIFSRAAEDFVFEADLELLRQQRAQREQGFGGQYEIRLRRKNGGICWCSVSSTVLKSNSGDFAGSFAMFTDITERKRAEDEMRLASLVYQASSQAMMVTDAVDRIIAVNPAFTEITGYRLDEILNEKPRILSSGRHDDAFYRAMADSLAASGSWQGEIWSRRKNGEIYPESLAINTVYKDDGSVQWRVALFSDISKDKANEDLIWWQANYDMLTELPNRRMVYDRMNEEIKRIHRDKGQMAVLFIDLDHFKDINDNLGHEVGDSLLQQAAQRMKHCIRESDIIGRLGGDEFVIILDELDDANRAGQVANKLLDQLAAPYSLGIEMAYVSASIGVTIYPDDASDAASLLKNADQAMYAAKRQGRNRFHYYTPAMQEAAAARMRLGNDLHQALAGSQFKVYYQPVVDLATGKICKAEALVRWQHPRLGLVSPAQFIPIAEDTGQIVEIGDWVFREAALQAAEFRHKHHPEFQISVNISPVQFKTDHKNHTPWFEYLLGKNLSGQSIVVEITEGLLMETRDEIGAQLLALRANGMQVALDDFGTGYSSLSYLKKFDIDYLKIDQSFVRNLVPDSSDMALCEAMIVMAHKLGIKVIAEGVEMESQRDLLKQIGCDFGQGYLWSKPVPGDEFEKLLIG